MKVTVIGSGLIGLSTAATLHHAGHDVVLLDSSPISGATFHAGGMLAPAAEMVYQQDPLFPLMKASKEFYPDLLGLLGEHRDVGYRDEGTLVVAADRADAQHVRELAELQRSNGMEVDTITTRQARALEPALSPRLAGAVSVPGDHQVNPRQFANALLTHLTEHVVRQRALRIEGSSVVTEEQVIEADQVVIANGLGARELVAPLGIDLLLRPVYGDIVRMRVAEGRPSVTRVIRGFVEDRPVYVIPRHDDSNNNPKTNTVAIGATTREDGCSGVLAGGVYDLLRDAIRLVPAVEEYEFLEATAGARPGTPDDLPLLGRLNSHVVLSTGYFRHGILLAALAARVGCELVEGRRSSVDISACSPTRFN